MKRAINIVLLAVVMMNAACPNVFAIALAPCNPKPFVFSLMLCIKRYWWLFSTGHLRLEV